MGDASTRAGRLDFLDGVRGVASLAVAIHHTLESLYPEYSQWSHHHVDFGRLGIVAFFLVSGYVVGLTLTGQTAKTFAVRRFWRLYPIYWIATVLWIIVWLATGHSFPPEVTVWAAIVNVLMIQGFIGAFSILNPAWTLGVEVAFYTQSIAAKLIKRLHWVSWIGWGWLAVFGAMSLSNWLRHTSFSAVVPLMMFTASVGFALFRWDTVRDRSLFPLLFGALVIAPVFGIALGAHAPEKGVWPATGFDFSYLAGFALFAAFYAIRRVALPAWLLWLGAISYSLYLIHVTVIQIVGATPLWGIPVVGEVAAVGLAIVAAWLMHIFIERPSTNFGRRLTSTRKTVEPAP
jgi:peptidoglycan/LPS O-acetylase OafA/YrhL